MNDDDEEPNRRRVFCELAAGRRPRWFPEDGRATDREPVLTDADRRFLLAAHGRMMWSDVQKYGRTAQTTPQTKTNEPAVVSHRQKKRPATARERLLARRDELKAAIRRLRERR